jgi:hypothetical protein
MNFYSCFITLSSLQNLPNWVVNADMTDFSFSFFSFSCLILFKVFVEREGSWQAPKCRFV